MKVNTTQKFLPNFVHIIATRAYNPTKTHTLPDGTPQDKKIYIKPKTNYG
jgi:hypothetical protein